MLGYARGAPASAGMRPEPVTVSAPGRVDLIGEHTDYSLLPVLLIAIPTRLQVHAEATGDRVVEARSEQLAGAMASIAGEAFRAEPSDGVG